MIAAVAGGLWSVLVSRASREVNPFLGPVIAESTGVIIEEPEAAQILSTLQQNSQVGFNWVFTTAPTLDSAENGLVLSHNPGPGGQVTGGSTVTLVIGGYTAP